MNMCIRRGQKVRVKTAKGRKLSSTRWLRRQLNDPYVTECKKRGFRSRSAFKLLELDDKFGFLKPGIRAVDLGAAPGGWTQAILERCGTQAKVVAVDIAQMEEIAGAVLLRCDIFEEVSVDLLKQTLDGPVDIVVSDMAPSLTGHKSTDHLRVMTLVEAAMNCAVKILVSNGIFIAKVFQGGTENVLLACIKQMFKTVHHVKPAASRRESSEIYVVAIGFKGCSFMV